MRAIVLDASVALRWYLSDEQHGNRALEYLTRYLSRELDIIGPSLLEFEVANALVIAQKRKRIEEDKITLAMQGFSNLGLGLRPVTALFPRILYFSRSFSRSAYDASYLAIAEDAGADLITADAGLFNAVREKLPWVKWIGEEEA